MKIKFSKLEISPGIWKITGEKWTGCYCNREWFEIVIEQEKRPNKKDVLKRITDPEGKHAGYFL